MFRNRPNRQATVDSMVFRPTWEEFKDLTKYGTHMEKNCRLAKFEFAKIKPLLNGAQFHNSHAAILRKWGL